MLTRLLNLFRKQKKVIYHTGAWSGNFGDSILQQSIRSALHEVSPYELEFRYINCQRTEFEPSLIDEINNEGDMLLIGGGGLVFYRPQDGSKSGWQWNIEYENIDRIKIPFVVYGVGYNQFEYDTSNFIEVTNRHLQKTVQQAALFSVRNNGTRRDLMARGCDGNKIEVIPDSGMFLPAHPITIPSMDNTKVKIGFNWTTDREHQTFPAPFEENRDKFLQTCIELLNFAITERNAQIFHIGHMGYDFDYVVIQRLKEGLVEPPIIIDEVLRDIYPPSDENAGFLVDVYRQMDVVLGMRGHANIVSFGQNTPFIGIGSHRKIRYFLEDVGRADYFFDVRTEGQPYHIDMMKERLDEVINNHISQKRDMEQELNKQKQIFKAFNEKVVKILG